LHRTTPQRESARLAREKFNKLREDDAHEDSKKKKPRKRKKEEESIDDSSSDECEWESDKVSL
jgi:hypothetical protein